MSEQDPENYRLSEEVIDWAIEHFRKVHPFYFSKNDIDIENLPLELKTLNLDQLNDSKYFQIQHKVKETV